MKPVSWLFWVHVELKGENLTQGIGDPSGGFAKNVTHLEVQWGSVELWNTRTPSLEDSVGRLCYQSPGQGSLRESWNNGEPGDRNAAQGGEERGETPSFFLLFFQIQLEVSWFPGTGRCSLQRSLYLAEQGKDSGGILGQDWPRKKWKWNDCFGLGSCWILHRWQNVGGLAGFYSLRKMWMKALQGIGTARTKAWQLETAGLH